MLKTVPKPRFFPQLKIERLPRRKAVTIGVGFHTADGIVLCSDRQHTSSAGFKFEKRKLSGCAHINGAGVIFSYAGEPEAADILFTKVRERILDGVATNPLDHRDPPDIIREVLEDVFNSPHSKGLETLIGVRNNAWFPRLYRTNGRRVVLGEVEQIGCGDSSVVRYLSELFLGGNLSHVDAAILGSYLISAANRFIDGCGGGPDVIFLPDRIHHNFYHDTIVWDFETVISEQTKRFQDIEKKIGEALARLLVAPKP